MKRVIVGIAWFQPDQWPQLREVSADRESLETTHEEWERTASKTLKRLRREGIDVRKVPVDIAELVEWCNRSGTPINSAARADFASHKLREANKGHSPN